MAQKLGITCTPEMLQLSSNEEISGALMQAAIAAGKSEDEIVAAMA